MPDAVLRTFRDNREGLLLHDGLALPIRFVIDGRSGRVVFPCPPIVLEADELVLHVPEERDDALQALLSAEPIDPSADAADRWSACFGTPRFPRWASCRVESARLGDAVIDGDALHLVNPLLAFEPALCRRVNADPAALTRLCRRLAGVDVPGATCVGVDPGGIDVRARFGIVRLPFPREAGTPAEAESAIRTLFTERAR